MKATVDDAPRAKRAVVLVMTGWFLAWIAAVAAANEPEVDSGRDAETVLREVATAADRMFPGVLERFAVPGAAYCIVYKGSLLANGFGRLAVDHRAEIDPSTTRFRVASLSKSFVALAVAELVHQGKLELDVDVNQYLDSWRIPATFAEPITLHHLLTHTAGFEENNIGRGARRMGDAPGLGEYVRARLPARVRPVGVLISYSNYGFALAGHIVERVVGVPFDHHVATRIFEPVGMERSTFRWRAPSGDDAATGEPRVDGAALGHEIVDGELVSVIRDWDSGYPASMLWTTAVDMGRYISLHASRGRIGAEQVFDPAVFDLLHARSFSHHPRMSGSGYGLFERSQTGVRALVHSGYWKGFVSQLCIVPELEAGFFFSLNSAGGSAANSALLEALLDQLVRAARGDEGDRQRATSPDSAPEAEADSRMDPAAADSAADPAATTAGARPVERLVGTYRSCEHSRSTVERIAVLFETADVRLDEKEQLQFWGRTFRHVGGWVFDPVGEPLSWAPGPIVFRELDDGSVVLLAGKESFERVPWFETRRFLTIYMATPTAILVLAILVWPLVWIIRRVRGKVPDASRSVVVARSLAWAVALLNPGFLVAMQIIVKDALGRNGGEFAYGMPPSVAALQVVPHVTTLLALVMPFFAWRVWRRHLAPGWWCAIYLVCTVAALTYVPFFLHWNLLGFRY